MKPVVTIFEHPSVKHLHLGRRKLAFQQRVRLTWPQALCRDISLAIAIQKCPLKRPAYQYMIGLAFGYFSEIIK